MVKLILPNTAQSTTDTFLRKMHLGHTLGRVLPAGEQKDTLQAARESQLLVSDTTGRLTRTIIVSDLCFSSSAIHTPAPSAQEKAGAACCYCSDVNKLRIPNSTREKLVSF